MSAIQVANATSITDVISENMVRNPEVAAALNARDAVREEVKEAMGGLYPDLDLLMGVGYEWTDDPSTRGAQQGTGGDGDEDMWRKEASLNFRHMLFDGMATQSEVARQEARLLSADARVREATEQFALDATRHYLDVVRRTELLRLARLTLDNHVTIYDQIRRRSESGLGSLASIQQAESRLALAEVNVLAAENNLRDARANYIRVVGAEPPTDYEVPADLAMPASYDEALERAGDTQPTLQVAAADIEAAKAQYEAAYSRRYPTLHFEAERTLYNDIDGIGGDNEDFTAMLRLRYNLFNGGTDEARIRRTQHQIHEAEEIRNSADRQVAQSLGLSWNAYEILGQQVGHLETYVSTAEQTRDSYKKQFDIGQRSLLDLLDTENEVFSAQNSLTDTSFDYLLSQYRVYNGMGQLLEALEITPPQDVPMSESTEMAEAGQ
ncbi:channel protein TolC [Marinobacterium nitratireducens]|uniref:Channel protein TolC n=1 Tax=Marinobacterium nitratireducens TaxID=518897 RepID=A0A918DUT2_9GAMM|nr:TolC family outer membrane protein [Marinobacterium nitratireducens]GGO83100.1 channel protein TolC [Marinobacterium nitratireducens]